MDADRPKLSRRELTAWLALIFVVAAAVFGSLLKAPPLTWDDDTNIFSNPYFQSGQWWRLWDAPYYGFYTPVPSTVWAALYHLGGGAAWPFRALNLVLHLTNGFLVYSLLRSAKSRWHLNDYAVLLALALFLLHPLQVQSVAWISGGRDLMATTFALGAVAAYFGRRDRRRFGRTFSAATALFVLALLSKPSVAALPVVVLLLDWIINERPQSRSLLKMGLWLAFSAAVVVLARDAQRSFGGRELAPSDIAWGQQLLVVLDTYGFYLQKLIYPQGLAANYARTAGAALQDFTAVWSAILVLALLVSFGFLTRLIDRRYALIFAWFLALLPVSGLIAITLGRVSTVADHYHYPAMACLAASLAFVLSRLSWGRLPAARVSGGAILLAAVALTGATSAARLHVWASDEAFFEDMAKTAPDSYGTALGMSILMCERRQQYDEGVRWTEVALKERPDDILAIANQAYCFLHAKNYFRVIELEAYLGKLDLDELETRQPTAYSSLLASIGTAYIEQKEYGDGFQFLCEAYRVKPSEPGHARNLEIAADILRRHHLDPVCEDTAAPPAAEDLGEDTAPGDDPVDGVWPGAPGDREEPDDAE